jgi:SecDF, P1 head subdomain/Protein translocase subunit SecDF, P1 domain, N-terminal
MRDIDELLRSDGAEWRASQPPSGIMLDAADFPASARLRVGLNRFAVGAVGLAGAIGLALLLAVVWLQRPTPPNIGQPSLSPSPGAPASTAAAECYRGEYRVTSTPDHPVIPDDLSTVRSIIEQRIDTLGVVGAIVQVQGSDLIVVQLPCVSDVQGVRDVISATGRLDFVPIPLSMTDVGQGTVLGTSLPACPDDLANLANPCVLFSGDQIASVSSDVDSTTGQPVLNFTLKSAAATLFDKFAAVAFAGYDGSGNGQFAIVLDGTVVSAPTVNARRFGGQGQIGGSLTAAEVNKLVTMLRYGALPLPVEEVSFTQLAASATPAGSHAPTLQPTESMMPAPTGYTVTIAPGLQPKWNAEAAASAMLNSIVGNERRTGHVVAEPVIISVAAMAGSDVPTSVGGPYPEYPVCWVVHAHGTFVGTIGGQAAYGSDGTFIYDDNGDPFATHMILPMPSP